MAVTLYIYDAYFHSFYAEQRRYLEQDLVNARFAPMKIVNNVFIGAHSTIKGVTIRDGSVVGACSVATKNITDNKIWIGNPVVFIRKAISPDATFKLKDGEA